MKVLVTGATGFIGKPLVQALVKKGHEIVVLSRYPAIAEKALGVPATVYQWQSDETVVAQEALMGIDGVIHLAGEGIADKRWSKAQKKKIYDSRINGTRNLVAAINHLDKKPAVFVSASAIGFYGDRGEEALTEQSTRGSGFLSDVCRDWEYEASQIDSSVRLALVRTGIVLGRDGGALKKLLPIFNLGLGGPIGLGKQWMSWIHLEDLVALFCFCLENPEAKGPINGVAPNPVTNKEFSKALGRVLHRLAIFPVPPLILKVAMGELSQLVLASQKILPGRAQTLGFPFRYAQIEPALAEVVKKKA